LSGDNLADIRTDSASSTIGEQDGLLKKLTKLCGLTNLVGIHCTAHRLNVTVLSNMQTVQCLDEVDHMLATKYRFYRKSLKTMMKLQNYFEALECELSRPQYLHTFPWIATKVVPYMHW
jgi:hypothetical protein